MNYHRVEGLELPVSGLGLGGEQLGGYGWTDLSEDKLVQAVDGAIEKGITLFDTAPIYGLGRSEELLGKTLGRRRKRILIATKVGLVWDTGVTFQKATDSSPANIRRELEASLKRLNTDYIDLYQIHWPDPHTPVEDMMSTMEKLKKEGKIRAVGLCNFSLDLLKEALKFGRVAALQVPYNLIDRDAEKGLLLFCARNDIAVIAYTPLAKGLLSGKYDRNIRFGPGDNRSRHPYFQEGALEKNLAVVERVAAVARRMARTPAQVALRWVLANPAITAALVGVKDASQLAENITALELSLSAGDIEFLKGKELPLPSKVKSAVFACFNKTVNLAAGSGLGKVPGVNRVYHAVFKTLWPDRNIIEVEGSRIYVNLKDELLLRKTFEAYITTPHWDEMTTKIFKSVVREGDTVLDLGANLGYYSLLAARLVGPKGRVYSFEPEPRNYRLLLKNIELNRYDNVVPLQKAVSDKTGVVKLHMSAEDSGAHTIRDSVDEGEYHDTVEIEAVRLDDFFADKPLKVRAVKMDVEGFEPQALAGMEGIIRENPDIKLFIEFYPKLIREAGSSPEEFARHLMQDLGFSILAVDDDWKNRKQVKVGSVAELMDFMRDKLIINLFAERA